MPSRNGARRGGAILRLMRRLKQEHEPVGNQAQPTTVSENGESTALASLFIRLDRTLAGEPLDFYSEALPQAVAEEIPNDISADLVAVLLDDEKGSFRVVGGVGLAADERHAVVDQRHRAFLQAALDGMSVFHDPHGLRAAAAGIPGTRTADALVMLPLLHGTTWLGMLLVGRRSHNGHRATPFSDEDLASVRACGTEVASFVQSLVLARRLRECLKAIEPSDDDRHAGL